MSSQSTRDPIVLRLTPMQKEYYVRQTGMILPSSLSWPLAQLKRLSVVAVKAGTEALPISRSAVRQLLEPGPPGDGKAVRSSSRSPSPRDKRSELGKRPATFSPLCG